MQRSRLLPAVCMVLCAAAGAPAQDDSPAAGEPPGAGGGTEAGAAGGFGSIRGRILTVEDAAIPGAAVEVVETELETTTANDGSFELRDVPAGRQDLLVNKLGYAPIKAPVEVEPGRTVETTIRLFSDTGKVMTITGKLRASARSAVLDQRFSGNVQKVMSREEMGKSTGGDAAAVAQELPGVSTVGGKYVYVRGLGARYSQTLLNGGTIPSPEPDRREVPLDLFPTNLLESIAVVKTYSPDMPGEFAGGSVQIQTVEVPEERFFKVGVGFKYRQDTTLEDFKTYKGGNYDWFTFDDGTRSLPDDVPADPVQAGVGGSGLSPEELQAIGRSFENIWNVDEVTAPFDTKVSLSFGDKLELGTGTLGLVGAVNWANKYQNVDDEVYRVLANGGSREEPDPIIFDDYKLDSSTFEAELSALGSLTYEINEGQKVGLRALYTRSSSDETRIQTGQSGQRPQEEPIRTQRLRYIERSLFNVQPYGQHLLEGDLLLEWQAAYALSQRDEPDNRQVRYLFDPSFNEYRFENVFGSGQREFYQLDENIYNGSLDLSIPFAPLVPDKDPTSIIPEQKIKLGTTAMYRDRDFDARRFRFVPAGGNVPLDENGIPIDLAAQPEDLFRPSHINPDGFEIQEQTRTTDNYEANQTLAAGYGLVDFRLHPDWRVLTGARIEYSQQEVISTPAFSGGVEETFDLETTDVLPALNLIWEFVDDMQARLGASQTVSRPEFRELSPFEYTDVQGTSTRGNPELDRAKIWNVDLGWEWYPIPGDVISANFFYKHFDSPIEVVQLPTASQLITTWDNADDADLYGIELEIRKNLGFTNEYTGLDLDDLNLIANFAWMDSEVRISDDPVFQQTNNKRPLQGQPEYLLNLGLLYENRELGLSFQVMASTYGERLSAVGATGLDDKYEQPRWDLNMSISKKVGKGTIKLTGENLLNDEYEWTQNGITTNSYKKGFTIGLGYSYNF